MKTERIPQCTCRFPSPGPFHWDWRCLRCSGQIVFKWNRWIKPPTIRKETQSND